MNGEISETVKHHPYLGVELNDNLKYNTHIDNITGKASQTLGFIKRNLKSCPISVKDRAYQTLVRPELSIPHRFGTLNSKPKLNRLSRSNVMWPDL